MTLQQQFQDIFNKLRPIAQIFVRRYLLLATFLLFTTIYGVLILRVNQLSGLEPTDPQVSSELKTVLRPKVDEQTLKKIQELQDQNIQVKSLFEQARQNPFAE